MIAGCALACQAEPPLTSFGSEHTALTVEAPAVTVSFTFDDTLSVQEEAASILESHGLRGTFYVNSPRLHQGSAEGDEDYLSIDDALDLEARGHELGGHTLSHLSLPTLSNAEAAREIMNDRRELLRLGLHVRSLAYPFGDVEERFDALSDIVERAGYSSARDTNGFELDRCDTGPESLPPAEPFLLRSVRSVNNAPPSDGPPEPADTRDTLLGWLDRASSCGGGYLPLIFHELRDRCAAPGGPDGYCFDLPELDELAGDLASGRRCRRVGADERCYDVRVAPVSEALGQDEVLPSSEAFAVRNASLERTLESGNTECLEHGQGDGGTARFARSTGLAHSGAASEHLSIAAPYVAPAELRITRDFGACALFVTAGEAYDLSLFYRADPERAAPTLRFVVQRLTREHVWQQWTTGMPFAAASPGTWVQRTFTTLAVPSDTLALSFGLRQESAGGVSVDDFAIAPAE